MIRLASHEMRTPLNAVTMGLELLEEELEELGACDKIHGTLRDVKASCKASVDVLNELLLFEKMEAGITKMETAMVQALSVFQAAIEPFVIQVGRYAYL